jgi:Ca2+-binding EF-hand superfamily protein
MKSLLLLLPVTLASCASSDSAGGGSNREREDMERKLIGFQEKYDRFDDNGDGYLTRSEVTAGIINEQIDGVTADDVPKIFAFYDTNGDGRISLAEINAGYAAGPDAALRAQRGQ